MGRDASAVRGAPGSGEGGLHVDGLADDADGVASVHGDETLCDAHIRATQYRDAISGDSGKWELIGLGDEHDDNDDDVRTGIDDWIDALHGH